MPGSRQVRSGSSAITVPMPDQDGVALRPQQMHPRFCSLTRYRHRLAAGRRDLVVGGYRELEDDMRTLVANAPEMPGMIARGFRSAQPDIHRDAGGAQPCMALASHFRIGILDRRHHTRNAGRDDGIGAGRRLADMRARLQRHIERGAPRGLAGALQRFGLGMGTAACLRPAAADDDSVLDHDRADGGIGPGTPQPAPAERQRKLHEALVGGLGVLRFLRVLVFQDAEDHLRNRAIRASSSPDNSPSTASKSLASRKLR